MRLYVFSIITFLVFGFSSCTKPAPKVLFVLTSHNQLGETGKPTGYYLSEVTHPWYTLNKAGISVDFVSPKGGNAPIDPKSFDLNDTINALFWNSATYKEKIKNTYTTSQVVPANYKAIHYVGGHGAMWDIATDTAIANIATKIYDTGGIVSAVCHGPAGLLPIKLPNGDHLIKGKQVAAFTNKEEKAVNLDTIVPFLLENELKNKGAIMVKSVTFKPNVVEDRRLITGQNPQSAFELGKVLVRHFD